MRAENAIDNSRDMKMGENNLLKCVDEQTFIKILQVPHTVLCTDDMKAMNSLTPRDAS